MTKENFNYSILRDLEYRTLANVVFSGEVLDLGGSKKSGYHELMGSNCKITTVNIDKEYGCDLVFDIQKKFPIEDGSCDDVLCVNVLEHIYGFNNVFSESCRVLKNGGRLILFTPFMYQIHGSPDDYFRYTKSALSRLCIDNGFKEIEIKELGYGLFSLFFQITGGAIPTNFLKKTFQILSVFMDKCIYGISGRYYKISKRIPMGYFVVAKK